MAHIYRRKGSPFWWLKFRDKTGKIRRESLGLRVGIGRDTRRAQEIAAERTLAERRTDRSGFGAFNTWVPQFLVSHCKSPLTLTAYRIYWTTLEMFLSDRNVTIPAQVTREMCFDYARWRQSASPKDGKYRANGNTAKVELTLLSLVMGEAVQRGYVSANPCHRLGIPGQPQRIKPEFTDDHLALIEKAIAETQDAERRHFFNVSYQIARYHGCRLIETCMPLSAVDLAGNLITFRIKGGRTHTAPLNPKLRPMFERLISEGRAETYPRTARASWLWWDFFNRIGLKKELPGACFHCLRVTAVSRLARAGVPESKAMKFIGHASVLAHRIYLRLRTEDLSACLDALK